MALNGNGSIDLTNGTFTLPPPVMGAGTPRRPVGGFVEQTNDPDTWRNGLLTVECAACEHGDRLCDSCLAEINEDVRIATSIG